MAVLAYIVLFVLPIMAFIAFARMIDESFVALLGFGAALLVFLGDAISLLRCEVGGVVQPAMHALVPSKAGPRDARS